MGLRVFLLATVVVQVPWVSQGRLLHMRTQTPGNPPQAQPAKAGAVAPKIGFEKFCEEHASGRGIWKWTNALQAYQRHMIGFSGKPVNVAEVGVQSGGSIDMWKAVLGKKCHVYGLDINPATKKFEDSQVSITIGDQADGALWRRFFSTVIKGELDILVDDGGHEPNQMLVTLMETFDQLSAKGTLLIEDIHGESYMEPFWIPTANFLGYQASRGRLESIHVYPYILVALREQGNQISYSGTFEIVDGFESLWRAIPRHPGGYVILENPGWGPFLTGIGITNFFKHFAQLHQANWFDTPTGCRTTSAAVCTVTVSPNRMQGAITGFHIYANRLVVDVAKGPADFSLKAVRRGTTWLPYAKGL